MSRSSRRTTGASALTTGIGRRRQLDPSAPTGPAPSVRPRRRTASVVAAALLTAAFSPLLALPAQAAVAGVGPVDPQNGFPTWYSDGTTKLQLCYVAGAGCLAEPPDPDAPASYPDNFPEEAFWFNAEASGGNLGLYEAALEGAHLNGEVKNGEQMGFARLRFRVNGLVDGASYTITHPYGVNTFKAAGGRINTTIDAGSCAPTPRVPCDWAAVGEAFLGDDADLSTSTFLRQVGAAPGTLGDIGTARPVTGSPTGNNFVRVDGPNAGGRGVDTLTVNAFTVQGLIYDGPDDAPSTPDLAAASDSGRSSSDNITNVTTPTFTGTVPGAGAAGAPVELLVDDVVTPVASGTTADGAYSIAVPTALTPGKHTLRARTPNPAPTTNPDGTAVDPAPAPYLVSGALTFTVDTTAPTATVVAPFPSNPSMDSSPTLSFSSEAGATFECQLLPANATWTVCGSPVTYDAQLDGEHTFAVRATDLAGNTGAADSRTWRIGPPDTTAPSLVTRAPQPDATAVPVLGDVAVTFSEPVTGVDGQSFVLRNGATVVPAAVSYDPASRVATLNPDAALPTDSRYTVSLGGGILDASRNPLTPVEWSFSTADTVVPTVTGRAPADGTQVVAVASDVTARFSEPVKGVSGDTFTLEAPDGALVPAIVTYDAGTGLATLDPSTALAQDTTYTATLTGGSAAIRDSGDLALPTTSWTFTTGAAPTVTARTPASGARGISVSQNVTATFSEAVRGVAGATVTLKTAAGADVPATVRYNATTRVATLDPTATLAKDTAYTVTLSGGAGAIRDAAGNPLTSTSWSFTTGPAPTITARTPASGATAVRRTANVTATFSEKVTGVGATTVVLTNTATGASVRAVVSYSSTTRTVTLNPAATLAARTRYTVKVTGGPAAIRDAAGNALATTSWKFTTGA